MNNAITISVGGMTLTVPGEYQGTLEIDGKRLVFSGVLPVSLDVEFRWKMNAGKINAIKMVRQMLNNGLGEAKAMVETGDVRIPDNGYNITTKELPAGQYGKISMPTPEMATQLREALKSYGYVVKG